VPKRKTPVAVVGAGIAGLVAALELSGRGHEVVVLERAELPGGKLRLVQAGGANSDAGPTVFTLRGLFEDIFRTAGTSLGEHLRLQPLGILARHAWSDTERFDLHADVQQSAAAIEAFAGSAEARGYLRLCKDARAIYETLDAPFLKRADPSLPGLVRAAGLRGLPGLLRLRPFTSLWTALGGYFKDPRLRQLFGRYATYCGSSPWLAPATLMLVTHVEQAGVWQIEGGMHSLATALQALLQARGVELRCASAVERIRLHKGRVAQLDLASGERMPVSAVVLASDAAALAAGLYGSEVAKAARRVPPPHRSLSALTFNLRATSAGFPLLRHNVFFSGDYRREFEQIFNERELPSAPTVYVCAQDRELTEPHVPGTPERLFCLVNAPANGDSHRYRDEEIQRCLQSTLERLQACGLTLHSTPTQRVITTPTDFNRLFPGNGGALYGPATHGWRASFTRPGARSTVPGLYLAGGSTHPGPGLPMAALSGRHAARCLLQDLVSKRPSRPAATPGGTSMH
jgi:1-hydroxycarotenoid 3,4-desaturase